MRPLNSMSLISIRTPSSWAASFARSTSKPDGPPVGIRIFEREKLDFHSHYQRVALYHLVESARFVYFESCHRQQDRAGSRDTNTHSDQTYLKPAGHIFFLKAMLFLVCCRLYLPVSFSLGSSHQFRGTVQNLSG